MQRMTDVLSSILNDPATRAALSGGGEDSFEGVLNQQEEINHINSVNINEERHIDTSNREQQLNYEISNEIGSNTSRIVNSENDQEITNESIDETTFVPDISSTNVKLKSKSQVPVKIESSPNERKNLDQPVITQHVYGIVTTGEQSSNETESSSIENNHSMIENLQDRLTTMRDGFLERYDRTFLAHLF
jgi:hypothetical protein